MVGVTAFGAVAASSCSVGSEPHGVTDEPSQSSVYYNGTSGYSSEGSLAGLNLTIADTEFGIIDRPGWTTAFEDKSDYETIEEFRDRFRSASTLSGQSQERAFVTYLPLGPLVGTGPNGEKGAVKLSYSVEDRTATFVYNPSDLSQTIYSGDYSEQHPESGKVTIIQVADVDCASDRDGAHEFGAYQLRESITVPMDRETAERLNVLTSPNMLAVARLKHDLSDERYRSDASLTHLVTKPYEYEMSLRDDGVRALNQFYYGPTTVSTHFTSFDDYVLQMTYLWQIADLAEILIADSESLEVLYRLPGCSRQ